MKTITMPLTEHREQLIKEWEDGINDAFQMMKFWILKTHVTIEGYYTDNVKKNHKELFEAINKKYKLKEKNDL